MSSQAPQVTIGWLCCADGGNVLNFKVYLFRAVQSLRRAPRIYQSSHFHIAPAAIGEPDQDWTKQKGNSFAAGSVERERQGRLERQRRAPDCAKAQSNRAWRDCRTIARRASFVSVSQLRTHFSSCPHRLLSVGCQHQRHLMILVHLIWRSACIRLCSASTTQTPGS